MANNVTKTARPTFLEHHFANTEQQFDAAKLGMWLFLATEILFFGGLFAGYIVYRILYPDLFSQASEELDTLWGTVNTLVLIGSSLSVAMAIKSAQLNQVRNIAINLCITISLAFVFLIIKTISWAHHFSLGIFPGRYYTFEGIANPRANVFFSFYYLMTGLHGLHVVIGIGLMTWLLIRTRRGDFDSEYYTPIEITGLYWHLVDIIWIFLFPLFYLIH